MKNMNEEDRDFSDAFYGSVTVGERGQIVIPAEARKAMGIYPGEKLLIMKHPQKHGFVVFKLEAAREILEDFTRLLRVVEESKDQEEG